MSLGSEYDQPGKCPGNCLTKAVGYRGMTWMLQRHDRRYDSTTLEMQNPAFIRDKLCFISRRYCIAIYLYYFHLSIRISCHSFMILQCNHLPQIWMMLELVGELGRLHAALRHCLLQISVRRTRGVGKVERAIPGSYRHLRCGSQNVSR